ncbi:hypothetical protein M9458_038436, partial [Cirrhinus mrigala]
KHDERLRRVLSRLQEARVTLNEKCEFSKSKIKFLGQIVEASGVSADPDKLEAVKAMRQPCNVSEVRWFLGMVNHLGKFLPPLAAKTQPLRDLLRKSNMWVWGSPQQEAFKEIKEELTTPPGLALYDPNKDTVVSANASSLGLGAVLLQKQADNIWKPVAYASKALSNTEQRYAQIEKEALASTWACERFAEFLIGKSFHIETDHKPLVPLLSSKKLDELPPIIQRLRMRLLRFSYTISHVAGKNIATADVLSRAPINNTAEGLSEEDINLYADSVVASLPATERRLKEIQEHQDKDSILQQLKKCCVEGWPDNKDLAKMIENCDTCARERVNFKETMLPTEFPTRPWSTVGADLFQKDNKHYLVIVDYFSRFFEVSKLTSTTAEAVIEHFKSIFARHGIPEVVRSDNGPQFASECFRVFAQDWGFNHVTSSPHFPQSNGEAERAVRTIKNLLKKSADPYLALMAYRAAPLANGYSPAELLMGRKLRTRVPVILSQLNPESTDLEKLKKIELTYRQKQKQNFDRRHKAHDMAYLRPGEHVWVKDTSERGTVVSTAGSPRSYLIETPRGTLRRNRFHLSPTPKAPVTSDLPDSTEIQVSPCSKSSTIMAEVQKVCQPSLPDTSRYPSRIRAPPGYLKDFVCS